MSDKAHWEKVYAQRADSSLSWYQAHAQRSLALIESVAPHRSSTIIDVGGGASGLSGELLQLGYENLWVLDISAAALAAARTRLGPQAGRVRWLESDVIAATLPEAAFDVWHDRAVFHFMTDQASRRGYVASALRAVRLGGHLVIATFAEDGPEACSGLPVARYGAAALAAQFGPACSLVHSETESHRTPAGQTQHFRYCLLRRDSA